MSDKVKGVISFCDGDRSHGMFRTIDIVSNHPIFTSGEYAPVAKKIGLDILALQVPSVRKGLIGPQLNNQPATYLMIDTVSGLVSMKWERAGTTLFVRNDKKPLTENHLEALWMFNDDILGAFGDDGHYAHAKMNRDKWNRFWDSYKDQQIDIIRQFPFARDKSALIVAWQNDINPLDV